MDRNKQLNTYAHLAICCIHDMTSPRNRQAKLCLCIRFWCENKYTKNKIVADIEAIYFVSSKKNKTTCQIFILQIDEKITAPIIHTVVAIERVFNCVHYYAAAQTIQLI